MEDKIIITIFAAQIFLPMKTTRTIFVQTYHAPCGDLLLGSFGDRLCLCDWITDHALRPSVIRRIHNCLHTSFEEQLTPVIANTIAQLDEYFQGKRQSFDLPLLFIGTDFQQSVWNVLLSIPFGKTVSYQYVAQQIANPSSVRAVANAVGANALSVIVPCHRVIGSNGTLTGYAGGLPAKQFLLSLEQK